MMFATWLARPCASGFDLFPFGPKEGDTANPKTDAGCGNEIKLEKPFPFYGDVFHQIWVCNNGILSFVDGVSVFSSLLDGNTFIAVFAENIDISPTIEDGNEIYWRLETELSTLKYINLIVVQNTFDRKFKATWALIVTFYKVGYSPRITDFLNTFQLVMACDDSNQCVCLLIYKEIQWTRASALQTHHAWAGFRHANGNMTLIPGSSTDSIANWPQSSNVGIDGLFIYRVDRTEVWVEHSCTFRRIEPFWAQMYYETTTFQLRDFLCNYTSSINQVPVVFIGSSFNITITATIIDGDIIEGYFPFWGKTEVAEVLPLIDGITRSDAVKVHFISPAQLSNKKNFLTTSVQTGTSGKISIGLQWESNYWATNSGVNPGDLFVTVFVIQDEETEENPFEITFETIAVPNTGNAEIPIGTNRGSLFFQIGSTNNSNCLSQSEKLSLAICANNPMTSEKPEPITEMSSCWAWYNKEIAKPSFQSSRPWYSLFGVSRGCPRRLNSRSRPTDADFARAEMRLGTYGWRYDPCCGGTPVNSCTKCRMNPGAAFCIQTPGFKTGSSADMTDNANQCCYSRSGNLLTEHDQGAGYAKTRVNRKYSHDFLRHELFPFQQCCEKESLCNLYWETRPVVIGIYRPRFRRINRGDPHFETLDGFQFTFNPLGVYNMLEKPINNDTTSFSMHVSTRRAGGGTVFSGFALRDGFTTAEFFLTVENETIVIINGTEIDATLFSELEMDTIQFSRNENSTEFNFNLQVSDFFVQASIFQPGILTLSISPPMSARGKTIGLLGNFDGVEENDLHSKDGRLIPTNSSWMTIHEEFGETWVIFEADWMFSFKIASLILNDIQGGSPYNATYTAEFESPELKQQAEEICEGDESCLLDVALTGKIEFAHNAVATKELVAQVSILNEVAESTLRGDPEVTTTTEQPQDEEETLQIDGKVLTLAAISIISSIAVLIFFISVLYLTYICLRSCSGPTSVAPNPDVFSDISNPRAQRLHVRKRFEYKG